MNRPLCLRTSPACATTPPDSRETPRGARRRIRLEYVPNPTKGGSLGRRGYLASNYSDFG